MQIFLNLREVTEYLNFKMLQDHLKKQITFVKLLRLDLIKKQNIRNVIFMQYLNRFN